MPTSNSEVLTHIFWSLFPSQHRLTEFNPFVLPETCISLVPVSHPAWLLSSSQQLLQSPELRGVSSSISHEWAALPSTRCRSLLTLSPLFHSKTSSPQPSHPPSSSLPRPRPSHSSSPISCLLSRCFTGTADAMRSNWVPDPLSYLLHHHLSSPGLHLQPAICPRTTLPQLGAARTPVWILRHLSDAQGSQRAQPSASRHALPSPAMHPVPRAKASSSFQPQASRHLRQGQGPLTAPPPGPPPRFHSTGHTARPRSGILPPGFPLRESRGCTCFSTFSIPEPKTTDTNQTNTLRDPAWITEILCHLQKHLVCRQAFPGFALFIVTEFQPKFYLHFSSLCLVWEEMLSCPSSTCKNITKAQGKQNHKGWDEWVGALPVLLHQKAPLQLRENCGQQCRHHLALQPHPLHQLPAVFNLRIPVNSRNCYVSMSMKHGWRTPHMTLSFLPKHHCKDSKGFWNGRWGEGVVTAQGRAEDME